MFDFRYHLASLVAVIVMLGVGLLLGSAIADRGTVETQRAALFNSLKKELDSANKTNDQLKAEVAGNLAFASASADSFNKNVLTGRTVALVANEGSNAGVAAATTALRNAGA